MTDRLKYTDERTVPLPLWGRTRRHPNHPQTQLGTDESTECLAPGTQCRETTLSGSIRTYERVNQEPEDLAT